jgi:hypothetical protein
MHPFTGRLRPWFLLAACQPILYTASAGRRRKWENYEFRNMDAPRASSESNGSGTCDEFFPVDTVIKLEALHPTRR